MADFYPAVDSGYGIDTIDGHNLFVSLTNRTKEQLAEELAELLQLSPQSAQLPMQDAIRATTEIAAGIAGMQLCLLDAILPSAFVLGDTPLPQSDLGLGFSVPLSKSLAVVATAAGATRLPMPRRVATQQQVDEINRIQFENARDTVIGPSAVLLKGL